MRNTIISSSPCIFVSNITQITLSIKMKMRLGVHSFYWMPHPSHPQLPLFPRSLEERFFFRRNNEENLEIAFKLKENISKPENSKLIVSFEW